MTSTSLSHYKIVDELGRGGMGIVYKAEDTKLDRSVAIKVLPSATLASDDDRERFYREAKAAAQLHHPNIASIFEIDEAVPSDAPHGTQPSPFIVMEFIEGETLESRIKKGPMKLKDAVRIAGEVAEALKTAHAKDIVHRDIKSANVMLSSDNSAKVLDFGLAKTAQSTQLTRMGSTLGTVAYMSPEQARGEEVDSRSDLWSLGVVLYEMITGSNPYGGDYEQAVVYSILNADPEPLTAVRTGVPKGLEWIVLKLLAKNAEDRYQGAKELIVDLRNVDVSAGSGVSMVSPRSMAASGPILAPAPPRASQKTKLSWPVLVGAVLLGAVLMYAGLSLRTDPVPVKRLTRVEVPFPGLQNIAFPVLSPTEEYLAVNGRDDEGRGGIFLRNMSTGEIRHMEGSEILGDREFGFSPDGGRIVFNALSNGGLYSVIIPAGVPTQITEFGRFAYWEDNDTVIMTDDKPGGGDSYRVSINGGSPEVIRIIDPDPDAQMGLVLKTNVPGGGRAFGIRLARLSGGNINLSVPPDIFTLDTDSGELSTTESNAINPVYVNTGFLMYQLQRDDGRLVVRPIDPTSGQFRGQPIDVLPQDEVIRWAEYSVTAAGDLLFLDKPSFFGVQNVLWMADLELRSLERLDLDLPTGLYPFDPAFSPDESKIVVGSGIRSDGGQIYVLELESGVQFQYTFDGNHVPGQFSPDGNTLFYTRQSGLSGEIVSVPADNSAPPKTVLESAFGGVQSPDGRWMAATGIPPAYDMDLLLMNMETGSVVRLDTIENAPIYPDFSVDSKYIAYQSTRSGPPDIIVQSVEGGERFVLPNITGGEPTWSNDGRYLYYATLTGVYRIPIRTVPTFNVLGESELVLSGDLLGGFDVSGDGTRIVFSATTGQFLDATVDAPRLVWLQNWSGHLEREYER